ncbi:MAG: hypothetical protein IJ941_04180, partial [Clostridia bacterium]|nr:hypothetical protein [Clostridia bacterium]
MKSILIKNAKAIVSCDEQDRVYFDADMLIVGDVPVKNESKVSYDGETGLTTFEYTFRKDTELTGYLK